MDCTQHHPITQKGEPNGMVLLTMLIIIAYIVAALIHDKRNNPKPKRPRITRIEDIDGRIYFRGAPPEEWKALEEEYQR